MSQDMAQAINDGLYYYEEDLWDEEDDDWVSVACFCGNWTNIGHHYLWFSG